MSKEEKATEEPVRDELQDKLDSAFGPDADSDETSVKDAEEKVVDETEEKSEESTDTENEATYDEKALAAAERFGLTEEDLGKLGEKGIEVATRMQKIHSDVGRVNAEVDRLRRQTPPQEEKPAPKAEELKPVNVEDWGEVGESHNALAKQVTELQGRIDGMKEQSDYSETIRVDREVDAFFTSLDKDVYPQFGVVASSALIDMSDEKEARDSLRNKAAEILYGREANAGSKSYQPMTNEQALKEALVILYPDAKNKAKGNKVKSRAGQKIPRATSGGGAPQRSKEDVAMDELADWQKRTGSNFFLDVASG